MKNLILISFCILQALLINAQEVMPFQEFLERVKVHHPIVSQSELIVEDAEQALKVSQGNFDPSIKASWSEKSLDSKEYYSNLNSKFSVPLGFGPELLASYETNEGEFLNPQLYTPAGGVLAAGLNLPIGKGLLYDARRAQVDQSKIKLRGSEYVKRQTLNDLVVNAAKSYLNWSIQYEKFTLLKEAEDLAFKRKAYIQTAFEQGDRPMMDTLEAEIYYQKRTIKSKEQQAGFWRHQTLVRNYLWQNSEVLKQDLEEVSPEPLEVNWLKPNTDKIYLSQKELLVDHAYVRLLELKNDGLNIERKLIKEDFKPTLNVRYNPLLSFSNNGSQLNLNNYKLGFDFYMPLYFRKARGKSGKNKIATENNDLKIRQTKQNLSLIVEAQDGIENYLAEAYQQSTESISNASLLYDLELQKFDLGESSLFIVNQRENSLLDLRLQQLELKKDILTNRLNLFKNMQTELIQ